MNTFTLGLIVVAYLLSLAYLGFLGYKKTTNTSDYLVGGRQMNPIVMALSYGATFISASAIVGFGGVAAAFGMGKKIPGAVKRKPTASPVKRVAVGKEEQGSGRMASFLPQA